MCETSLFVDVFDKEEIDLSTLNHNIENKL